MPTIESIWTMTFSVVFFVALHLLGSWVKKNNTVNAFCKFLKWVSCFLFFVGLAEINIGQMLRNEKIVGKILILFLLQLLCIVILFLFAKYYKKNNKSDAGNGLMTMYWDTFMLSIFSISIIIFIFALAMVVLV